MRTLIIGDLHGTMPNIRYKNFDSIVAVGDFCSMEGIREPIFEVIRMKKQNPDLKKEWYELIGKREARKRIKKSIEKGRKILEKLNSFGKPVYLVPGNAEWIPNRDAKWDFLRQDNYNRIKEGLKNIVDVHGKIKDIGDYQIIGYGLNSGPEYPQYEEDKKQYKAKNLNKARKEYEKLTRKYDKLFQKATSKEKPIIFLSHNVPFNTPLDQITNKDSPRYGYHYGSLIVREMIEKYQPIVNVSGHIHEHFGKYKIGKTTCINAGFGADANVWLEIKGNKIEKLKFYKK